MKIELDPHCHTIMSGHAFGTVIENAAEAERKGLRLIAVTDHAPKMPGSAQTIYFQNLRALPRFIGSVEIFSGSELNIFDKDGSVDLPQDLISQLDVNIASLHPPCYPPSTTDEHTGAVMRAMENPYIDIIGHFGDPRYPIDIETVVKKALETGTMIELNNASLNPKGFRAGGEGVILELIKTCVKFGVMVVISSDAHFSSSVGDMAFALKLAAEAGLPENLTANSSVGLFKSLLKKRG